MGTVDYQRLKPGRKRKGKAAKTFRTHSSRPHKRYLLERRKVWKALNDKDSIILEDETSRELTELMAYKYQRMPSFRSRVANPNSSMHRLVDREIIKRMGDIVDKGGAVALAAHDLRVVLKLYREEYSRRLRKSYETGKPQPGHRSTRKSMSAYLSPIARRSIKKTDRAGTTVHLVHTDHWDRTSPVLKALGYAGAIGFHQGRTFTLNLGQEVIEAGLRSKKGFAGFMRDRIVRELRNQVLPKAGFIPDFFFIVEGYRGFEELHLHGIIDADTRGYHPCPVAADLLDHCEDAFRTAGGKLTDRARQLKIKAITNLPGWIDYITKRMLTTADQIQKMRRCKGIANLSRSESLFGATLTLRRRGERWYRAARKGNELQVWSGPTA